MLPSYKQLIFHLYFCAVPKLPTKLPVIDVDKDQSPPTYGRLSLNMFGLDIYQEDLDTLQPDELINDTILTLMLR